VPEPIVLFYGCGYIMEYEGKYETISEKARNALALC